MKPSQVIGSVVGLIFLVCYTQAAVTGSLNKSNATSEASNRTNSDDISKLFDQLQPLAAASDNIASVSTLTSSSDGGPPNFVGNTVTSTSGNPAEVTASRVPSPGLGSTYGLPGAGVPPPLGGGAGAGVSFGGFPGSPLGGGVGIPFGGFTGFPGAGAGGGFDVAVGGGIIEKAVIVVGGGILILLALAAAQKAIVAGGLLKELDFGNGFDFSASSAGASAGSVSVAGPGGSAAASAAASASLSKNVDEAINRRF